MRPILVVAILLLGLSVAAPEPDYFFSYFADDAPAAGQRAEASHFEIESSTGRADRLALPSLQPHVIAVEILTRGDAEASADANSNEPDRTDIDSASDHDGDLSLNDLCNALYTSAQDNDLPIPFFANLIWQESRLREDAVSRKGALGIAQFMPQTAAESGLDNPFDPRQAIPASARFLRELRLEFGNLGFVAAAYNAGARRVIEWLEHRGSLPQETRGYVMRVTGLSVDAWRSKAVNDDALAFVQHLPCRSLPAFADVEQAQSEQVQLQQAKLEKAPEAAPKPGGGHVARRKHGRGGQERHEARRAEHERAAKREAERHAHSGRDKRNSV